ncbi:hypothetical protein [Paraburkholderia domus]|uniref:hypothetical protein n=1 Tax=Paraburkholderia domus TaxID=2793075 RepID=UPI0019142475|nr:hypothetical protein [Paraburkholderia domus]MBK5162791.1 hypothetical protein [Burkholderia sp. R-70211]
MLRDKHPEAWQALINLIARSVARDMARGGPTGNINAENEKQCEWQSTHASRPTSRKKHLSRIK